MRAEVYTVAHSGSGHLSVLARPRGGEWLPDEAQGWRTTGAPPAALRNSALLKSRSTARLVWYATQVRKRAGLACAHQIKQGDRAHRRPTSMYPPRPLPSSDTATVGARLPATCRISWDA